MAPKPFTPLQRVRSWTRDGFLVSTDPALVPLAELNAAFASEELYWAHALPELAMREMVNNSLCFGLYSPTAVPPEKSRDGDDTLDSAAAAAAAATPADTLHEIAEHVHPPAPASSSSPTSLIGFARCITDYTTFLYLTDVFILPAWQGQGLGNWLVSCVQEVVVDMPYLRRSMCIVGHGRERTAGFYKRLMGMGELKEPAMALSAKGPGSSWDAEGTAADAA